MATFMRCSHCGKVQRDIMGETIYMNDEGDVLDLDGKPADAIVYEKGWMPIKCFNCGCVARERDWGKATRNEWSKQERIKCWLMVQWDRFVEFIKVYIGCNSRHSNIS